MNGCVMVGMTGANEASGFFSVNTVTINEKLQVKYTATLEKD